MGVRALRFSGPGFGGVSPVQLSPVWVLGIPEILARGKTSGVLTALLRPRTLSIKVNNDDVHRVGTQTLRCMFFALNWETFRNGF